MMKKNSFFIVTVCGCAICLLAFLYSCSASVADTKMEEKKYTPLAVYFSCIDLFDIYLLPDFVSYPNDLAKFGLRDSVKEVHVHPYSYRKFNEVGNLTYYADWFDSNHRYGDEYVLKYDKKERLVDFYNVRTRGGSGASAIYTYDEQGRLKERCSSYYTRSYQYLGEDKNDYTVTTNVKKQFESSSMDFMLSIHEGDLTMKRKEHPEGYWLLNGYTRLSAENSSTQLCKSMVKTFYPDRKSDKNKLDSIVSTYALSYNSKDDVEQCLLHIVEYPSGKIWDCQINYTYEYDSHDNWIQKRVYSTNLRRLFGDFTIIETDQNGKSFVEDERTITYY